LNAFLDLIGRVTSIDDATRILARQIEIDATVSKALDFAIRAHDGQARKSGEPYVIHPILVGAIVASLSGDTTMVVAALLHDVVEDTPFTLETIENDFGSDVAHIVAGLTKIVEIRDENLAPSSSNERLLSSALSFRKMLLASIEDVRVLIIKLADRLHNMLTLDALPPEKRLRISEETMVVYAPIAHRLGIAKIKNYLEDLSFRHIYPEDYQAIDAYIRAHDQSLHFKLNAFIEDVQNTLHKAGYHRDDFEIVGRVKHHYSIYLKMHRKGISIEEVLDLLAIRIITKEPLECYEMLGALHLEYTPLISRFKDYIALPKENGYQTIHTTLFSSKGIVEAQIRTRQMHQLAEYGVAAHWKYKEGIDRINLDWLKSLHYQQESVEEFYELAKSDLYSEEITVFSPKGDYFTLPKDATALDFAYAIHSEVGDRATGALINKEKASLLTILKNGDIVRILDDGPTRLYCSWVDTVKTSKAKEKIRTKCRQWMRKVDTLSGRNILAAMFGKRPDEIEEILHETGADQTLYRAARRLDTLKEKIARIAKAANIKEVRFWELLKRGYKRPSPRRIDHFEFYTNKTVTGVEFDYCCHPKMGDEIVAFYKDNKAIIHHKLCMKAYEKIEQGAPMLYVAWHQKQVNRFGLIVSLQNQRGALAELLTYIAKIGLNVNSIELGIQSAESAEFCKMEIESDTLDRNAIEHELGERFKVIEVIALDDAYN
jgi:RelA/SpoT family (p)ppGpp synthetase